MADDDEKIVRFKRRILTSSAFVRGFVPPEYLFDGILQRRFFYSLTGKTGAGKTAIMLLMAAHIALGRPLLGRDVQKGRVLYLAGENDNDVRMRWIAMSQTVGFDVDHIDVNFIPGVFTLSKLLEEVRTEIHWMGEVVAIFVDTSAAFFEGKDENDNVQNGAHARLLRRLCDMPGGPTTLAACHPVKRASDDDLIPRGGGAYLAEVDGNLSAKMSESNIELHWQGKFRGADFSPVNFELKEVTVDQLRDAKGRAMPTVVASAISDDSSQAIAKATREREDQVLVALADPANAEASQADLAKTLGWFQQSGAAKGQPYRMQVNRTLKRLEAGKMVNKFRGRFQLTKKGVEEAKKLAGYSKAENDPDVTDLEDQERLDLD
jgi:hypothetical protein